MVTGLRYTLIKNHTTMKKVILSVSIAAIFAACGNPNATDQPTSSKEITTDTAGLSEYKQWKEQQDVVSAEGINEIENKNNIQPENTLPVNEPAEVYREPVRQPRVARAPKANRTSRERAVVKAPERTYGTEEASTETSTQPIPSTQPTVSSGPVVTTEPVITPAPGTKEKKGWSKAAKGTAIGAGSGAVLGAIISKKKGKGAVIGGIVGAAGGYVLGRKQDKKEAENQ